MISRSLLFLLLLVAAQARAQQSNLMPQDIADSVVALILRQPEIVMHCVCCGNDTAKRVKPLKASFSCDGYPYCWIDFEGERLDNRKTIQAQLDLKNVFANINGIGVALSDHFGLYGNSCKLPYDWKTGEELLQTFGMKISPEQAKRFHKMRDSLSEAISSSPAYESMDRYNFVPVPTRDSLFRVDYENAALEWLRIEGDYLVRYSIPLGYGMKAIFPDTAQLKIQSAYGKQIVREEYYDGYLKRRYGLATIDLQLADNFTRRADDWLNALNETFIYVPYSPPPALAVPWKQVVVSHPDSFPRAIASKTRILLRKGEYRLYQLPTIKGIDGLIIEGEDSVRIVAHPSTRVLNFLDCREVTLKNLSLSYDSEIENYPQYSVLGVNRCSYFKIENCRIGEAKKDNEVAGGSALLLDHSDYFSCKSSELHGGNGGLSSMWGNNHVQFENSVLRGAREGHVIAASDCKDLRFSKCTITANESHSYSDTPFLFYVDGDSTPLMLEQCQVTDNKAAFFTNNRGKLNLGGSRFSGNAFEDVKDAELMGEK